MLNEYQKLFDSSIDVINPKAESEALKKAEKTIIEDPEVSALTRKRLDEYEPFIGLNEGKLNKEEAELALSIKGHLNHYNNINSVDLNGLMRWLVKKDLNAA
jgi:hypothetical protein